MTTIDTSVGKRIRQRRKELGLSQSELANRIGVKFQQVQKYETGVNRVAASRLWNIAETLQVAITYFFNDLEMAWPAHTENAHAPLTQPETTQLIKILERLAPAQKSAMSSFLMSLDASEHR